MAVTSDPFIASDVAAFVPEVWTPIINEELFAKTVFANFITDLSPFAQNGGDIFHVPDIYTNTFSAQTQSTQGAEVTTAGPAQVDTTLTVNTHKYIAHIIGDKDKAQLSRSYDFNAVYARKTAGILASALEADIAALWSGLSTNSSGDTATVLNDSEVRVAINKLMSANFDIRECAWFIHPYIFWVQLAAIAKYYDMSQAVGGTSVFGQSFIREGNFGPMDVSRGLIGHLYGIPIFQTTNVVSGLQTYRNLLLHKSCLGFAVQTPGGSKVRVQADNLIQNLGMLTVSDIIYGVAELRDAAGVVVNGSSSFIGS